MRVLVTGGAGFIGSHLVCRLIRDGWSVVVLDDFSSGKMKNLGEVVGSGNLRVVKGDIRDGKAVNEVLASVDGVVHLAGFVDPAESVRRPLCTNDVNVGGTLNVLDGCVQNDVRRFVFASSAAVYGGDNPLPLREDCVLKPLSPYAASKVSCEYYCKTFSECYNLSSVVLRFFNVYGSGQGENAYAGVITEFLQSGLRGEGLTVYGDGTQTRDFIAVEDVVEAIVKSLSFDSTRTEVFNVCTGLSVSVNDLIRLVCKALDKNLDVHHVEPRAGDILHSLGDPGKAETLLGFKSRVTFEEGLGRLVDDLLHG